MSHAIYRFALAGILAANAMAQQTPVLFAGTDAGVQRSRDGGRSWQQASDGLENSRVLTVVGGMRNDGRIVYAGTDSGLYKTTDGAQRWTRVLNERNVTSVAVDSSDEQRVYATASGKLFSSIDGGLSWGPVTTPWSVAVVATDPFSTFRLYISAGRSSEGGVATTTDRGVTWQVLPATFASPLLMPDPNSPGRIFVGVGQVIQTRDYGQTWFWSGPSGNDLTGMVPEEFHYADPRVITALTADTLRPGDAHVCLTAYAIQLVDASDPLSDWRSRVVHGWGSFVGNLWSTGTFPNQQLCLAVLREPQAESVLFAAGTKIYRRESLQTVRLTELADLGATVRSLAAVRAPAL